MFIVKPNIQLHFTIVNTFLTKNIKFLSNIAKLLICTRDIAVNCITLHNILTNLRLSLSILSFPAPFSKALVTLTGDEDNSQGNSYKIWLKIYLKVVFL